MKEHGSTHLLPPVGRHPIWLLGLLALGLYHAWLTLGLFSASHDWLAVVDDQPILSGRHPLHLYHGYLGGRSLVERGRLSCYDPAFHAGYPKTPVFDSGSRPAELALALAGGKYSPAAYKVALAGFCLLVPWLLYVAARGAGLCRGVALLVAALGMCVFWGRPGREALEAGEVDLLLGSLMLLVQSGMLIRYHREPDIISLLGVAITGLIAWFAQPLLSLLAGPLFLIYYLTVGHRHRPVWHVPLFIGLFLAVAGNMFWLTDLVAYWWIRVPPCREAPLLSPRSWQIWWYAPLWGKEMDKALVVGFLLSGLVGILVLHRSGLRPTARLFGLGMLGFFALTIAGAGWEPFARFGAWQLLVTALLFATVPAAVTLARMLDVMRRWSGTVATPLVFLASVPAAIAAGAPDLGQLWLDRFKQPRPFQIGLDDKIQEQIALIRSRTTNQARILWEDRHVPRGESYWSALLPLLTERAFIGGLDADIGIEHATTGLNQGRLAGRPILEWSDKELELYCRKYNVGWVVCWSAEAKERFRRWGCSAEQHSHGLTLLELPRRSSFALAGSVRWISADARGILLADAVPAQLDKDPEGQVVLSLHHQNGMRVRPARVKIERAVDPQDAIPFIRLRMSEPVGRIFITWEGR